MGGLRDKLMSGLVFWGWVGVVYDEVLVPRLVRSS